MSKEELNKLQILESQVADIEAKLDSTIAKLDSTIVKLDNTIVKLDNTRKITEDTNDRVKKIEIGLFGDSELEHKGIIERQRATEDRLLLVEDRTTAIEQVNDKQEVSINAKKQYEDTWEQNLKRVFWGLLVAILLVLLISGKVGISDIIKGALN